MLLSRNKRQCATHLGVVPLYLSRPNWSAHQDLISGFMKSSHEELPDKNEISYPQSKKGKISIHRHIFFFFQTRSHIHTHSLSLYMFVQRKICPTWPAPAIVVVAVLVLDVVVDLASLVVDMVARRSLCQSAIDRTKIIH